MSQHDLNLANAPGATFRADANNALVALATLSSGSIAPTPTFPNQLWFDDSTGYLKKRNSSNTAWATVFSLDDLGQFSLKPGADDKNVVQVRNAANSIVMVLRIDGGGHGKFVVEDSASAAAAALVGSGGGRIFVEGDETTGKEIHPLEVTNLTSVGTGSTHVTTGVRADARKISVTINDVLVNNAGTGTLGFMLGTAGGFETATYAGRRWEIAGNAAAESAQSRTDLFEFTSISPGSPLHGTLHLEQIDTSSNAWSCSYRSGRGGRVRGYWGNVFMPGLVTQFRLQTTGGDLFTSGTLSWLQE